MGRGEEGEVMGIRRGRRGGDGDGDGTSADAADWSVFDSPRAPPRPRTRRGLA